MKKLIILPLLLIVSLQAYAKKPSKNIYTDLQIKEICDSIVKEGNLLYRYEKAAWIASDIGAENNSVRQEMFNYLVYEDGDKIKACLLNKKLECICEVVFSDVDSSPSSITWGPRVLTEKEEKLFLTKNTLLNNIIEHNHLYQLGAPDGYSLNFVLIPSDNGHRMYVLTGTGQHDIIPFGNDYIFFTDLEGNIIDWRKMHKVLIPMYMKIDGGEEVRETYHSHLEHEPFVTPTDICTFKLYGPLYGQTKFIVLSTCLDMYMTYNIESDTINFVNMDVIRKINKKTNNRK